MSAYHCTTCDTLHGWSTHPAVQPVTRHKRWTGEDVWWCPGCGQEHRTTDGTLLGQRVKRWTLVDDVDAWLQARARQVAGGFWWDPWQSRS